MANKPITKERCYFCKKFGHLKKDCVKYKKWIGKKNSGNIIFIASHDLTSVHSTNWWIDSGAIVHISTTLEGFLIRQAPTECERFVILGNQMR